MRAKQLFAVVLSLGLLAGPQTDAQDDATVDLALVLAVDCSYSVDAGEFHQQMIGLSAAFRNPDVIAAIASVAGGRIAVSLVQWSGPGSQYLAVDWQLVGSAEDAWRLAHSIEQTPRLGREGSTSIAAMLDAGSALLMQFPGKARRRVIDISSDGVNNSGGGLDDARDRAAALGITVNGLAIMNEVPALDRYFERHLITGSGAFVIPAPGYTGYGEAILRKLLREIASPNA